ncbi:hypothetical protein TWF694_011151 [Orbilia ellipsospora]|uniref:Uncharacterized protein n=1 Tax=Orbilia ellipsospora TaxID=2528407 RepID=A0AAV9X9A9_9PEZI
MDKVQKNLSDIERKISKAIKILGKGEALKLGDAIKLGRKNNAIVSTIRKGIKEYDGANPSAVESKKVLAQMKTIVTLTETQLELLITNKPHTEKLRVGGLVKRSILKSQEASEELSKLMLDKTPEDLKSEAQALEQRRKATFEKASAVYAAAIGGEENADGEDDSD